jgi:hydrophobe/amphiphile efflux-1 (HAE1) family protein
MSLYSSAVKKPVTTLMIFIGIVVFGIYSFVYVPIDFFPEMEPPIITVFTFYSGASAADIEENITTRLENSFSTLTNLKKITSTSKDNLSLILLEFEWGKNLDEATNEIRDALNRVARFLPEDSEEPNIFKFSTSIMPIMMLSATAEESYPAITDILEEKLVNPLNRIEGVGAVTILGGPQRAIMIDIDPRKLDAYNISLEQLAGIIGAENLNLPSGNIEMNQLDYPLRVKGEFSGSDNFKNIVITSSGGKPVYLRDIATVQDSLKKTSLDERTNGRQGVRIMLQKQTGANTVAVARKVKAKINQMKGSLPDDIKIDTIFDTSEYIVNSISNLSETLFYAALFVIVVVLFFLGRWRATFIIILTIPVSLIGAFIFLYLTNDSINIISLSALTIAIGMVVDDAIVVLENITHNIEKGSYPREASIYGTNEVALAVVATTLTVVAVFLPLTMIGGFTGEMFRPLGFIVSITISTSTIAALSLTPMLASQILRLKKYDRRTFSGKLALLNEKSLTGLDNVYEKTLGWALRHKALIIIACFSIFVMSIILVAIVGAEFMPASDNGQINVNIELAQGTNINETKKIARQVEAIIANKYPEVKVVSSSAGAGDETSLSSVFSESASYIINMFMDLPPIDERQRDIFEISDSLRKDLNQIPEIAKFNVDPGGSRGSMFGGGGGNIIEVKIFGFDIDKTNIVAERIAAFLNEIEGTRDVLISRKQEKPELQIVFDKEKLAAAGLNTSTAAMAVRNRINGLVSTTYREEGEEYDVIVRYAEEFRNSTTDIENITIKNQRGQLIKLKEIGNLEPYYSPPNIEREDKERVVTVSALVAGSDLGTIKSELDKKIKNLVKPQGVDLEIGGSVEEMQESFRDLGLLLVLSILLVYIVMAAQFESFREPFIIMIALPFAFTGVFLALFITNTTLNVISFIGSVMLVGIVVKNGIVLVDYTNILRDRGLSLAQAVIKGGRSRLRPVLMTTLTTLLAMVPLSLSTGEGAESWRPMGIAIIGGLLFSTLITMVIVPVIYSIFGAARIKRTRKALLKNNNRNNKI